MTRSRSRRKSCTTTLVATVLLVLCCSELFNLHVVGAFCHPPPCYTTTTTTTTTTTATTSSSSSNTVSSPPRRSDTRVFLTPSPEGLLSAVSSPLTSVTVLASVILIHEAGHFLAARSLNITVREFSVGVGPRVAGWSDGKRNITYSLRAVPLGGYVQFPENYNGTEVRLREEEARQERMLRRTEDRAVKQDPPRNPFMFGWAQRRRRQAEEEEERQRQQEIKRRQWWNFSKKKKKTKPQPSSSSAAVAVQYYDDPNLLQNRPWTQRAVVLGGGIVFNLILAFACYFGQVTAGSGLPTPVFEPGAIVRVGERTDAPSYGLLKNGDVIVGINGRPMTLSRSSSQQSAQQGMSDIVSAVRTTPAGDTVSLTVVRKDDAAEEVVVSLTPRPTVDPDTGEVNGPPSLGIALAPNYLRTDFRKARSVPDGLGLAASNLRESTTDTATSILRALSSMVSSPKGGSGNTGMSGPIGVIRMGSNVVSQSNYDPGAIAAFAAAISVNLAVVNALPLPALDGGQLVFVLAEAATGKKVDQRKQEDLNALALLLILVLSLSTAVGDIGDILGVARR